MQNKPFHHRSFFHRNGLSIVFLLMMAMSLGGQMYFGWIEHNTDRTEAGAQALTFYSYLGSGHFLQATFENWESEFLQMGLFVVFTIFLYQRGSSESKNPDQPEPGKEDELKPKAGSPWPVRRGGIVLFFFKHSLSISLFSLFFLSFMLHWYGSWVDFNEAQLLHGHQQESFIQYLFNSRLLFESFQNWQSEFLSVFAIIFLSIYLRQVGSPQSKAVNAPNSETGE